MAGVSQFACVQRYGFHSSFLIVFFSHGCKTIMSYCTLCERANQMLGIKRRYFHYKDRKTMLQLYKSMVIPYLQYAVQAWCPNKIKR